MKQRSYKATGINLKGMAMGESDRLVTVLTKEHGLVRAIAPGARKHKSRLSGRSGLFVVNDLLFTKGKSIDKLIQAETVRSFPCLSKDLAKLTASQYLAEIALSQALSDQPQEELYYLLLEHLGRLETAAKPHVLACLAQATFHLLALAGVAPEVFRCCLSREPLNIELGNHDWRVGFSVSSGGAVKTSEIERIETEQLQEVSQRMAEYQAERTQTQTQNQLAAQPLVAEASAPYSTRQPGSMTQAETETTNANANSPSAAPPPKPLPSHIKNQVTREVARNLGIVTYLTAPELALMQQLSKPELVLTANTRLSRFTDAQSGSQSDSHFALQSGTIERANSSALSSLSDPSSDSPSSNNGPHRTWQHIERALRHYAQYQIDKPIRSAALIDTCFTSPAHASSA